MLFFCVAGAVPLAFNFAVLHVLLSRGGGRKLEKKSRLFREFGVKRNHERAGNEKFKTIYHCYLGLVRVEVDGRAARPSLPNVSETNGLWMNIMPSHAGCYVKHCRHSSRHLHIVSLF